MTTIKIKNAKKVFGDTTVIPNLSVSIPEGSLFTLLGPSGCGKTTLLRMIAGFNTIEGGDFYFDENRINDQDPSTRNIGMVFQNYAIFPHLSVGDNVGFGLKQKKMDREKIKSEVEKYLGLIQMNQYRDRKPENLSGGQQQRVALARALAVNPDVLLMDEPLSNLDAKLRLDMRQIIRDIQKEVGITTVYVTHDQEEAMAISDIIAVMKDGEIQQIGAPKELYHRPTNEFVANFIGRTNIMDGNLIEEDNKIILEMKHGKKMYISHLKNMDPQNVKVSIRPEEFKRTENKEAISAKILASIYLGLNTEYLLELETGEEVQMIEESTFIEDLNPGDQIYVDINIEKINIFSEDGEQNLLEVKS